MTARYLNILLITSPVLLSGCGGSTGAFEDPMVQAPNLGLFATEALLVSEVSQLTFTNPSSITSLGSAAYVGVLSGSLELIEGAPIELAGALAIRTDLSTGSLQFDGEATDFVTSDASLIAGVLTLEQTNFDAAANPDLDYSFSGILEGQLDVSGLEDLNVSIRLEGDFYDEDAAFLGGSAVGLADTGAERGEFRGRFIVKDG